MEFNGLSNVQFHISAHTDHENCLDTLVTLLTHRSLGRRPTRERIWGHDNFHVPIRWEGRQVSPTDHGNGLYPSISETRYSAIQDRLTQDVGTGDGTSGGFARLLRPRFGDCSRCSSK